MFLIQYCHALLSDIINEFYIKLYYRVTLNFADVVYICLFEI